MKFTNKLSKLVALLGLLPLWGAALAGPVNVEIIGVRTSFSMTDIATVSVLIRNDDPSQSIALRGAPGFSEAGGLILSVIDANGVRRQLPHVRAYVTVQQSLSGERHVVLPPGRGLIVNRKLRVADLAAAAGSYTLQVDYIQPARGGLVPIDGAIEAGSDATSTTITITP